MLRKYLFNLIIIVLILLIPGCNTIQSGEDNSSSSEVAVKDKLLSSDDYNFEKALIHRQDETPFEVDVISWEFVGHDMIYLKGKRNGLETERTETGIRETTGIYIIPYEFLISKENVTFYTIKDRVNVN